jgi:hypothetical protein
MHWAGVSTVSVQSEQVLSNPAALRALVCESDINTQGAQCKSVQDLCHAFIACLLSSMRPRAGEWRVPRSLAKY